MRQRIAAILATIVSGVFCSAWALIPISRLRSKIGGEPPADLLMHYLLIGVLPRAIVAMLLIVGVVGAFRRNQSLGYMIALAAMPVAIAADLALWIVGLG